MSGRATPATAALDRAGVGYTVHAYRHDPGAEAYGVEAAAALGLDPDRVFKTLVVAMAAGAAAGASAAGLAVGIVPVAASLDLKAMAAAVGGKRAALADPVEAARVTGYVLGGISPLGQRRRLPTVLDASAGAHETIFVSAGRRGVEVELAPADLIRLTGARSGRIAAPR